MLCYSYDTGQCDKYGRFVVAQLVEVMCYKPEERGYDS